MTFEKRGLVEPSDFISVSYECASCQTAVFVPVQKINLDQVSTIALRKCPYCQADSGFQASTPEMIALLDFNRSLQKFSELSKGRNLRMRLTIPCHEKD